MFSVTTRLVSTCGTYIWDDESAEDSVSLLEKASLVTHEHCIPYLASVKANKKFKEDIELAKVEKFVVKVLSPDN